VVPLVVVAALEKVEEGAVGLELGLAVDLVLDLESDLAEARMRLH
jgi:hypothetical protein